MLTYWKKCFSSFRHCFIFYWYPEKSKTSVAGLLQELISAPLNFTQKIPYSKVWYIKFMCVHMDGFIFKPALDALWELIIYRHPGDNPFLKNPLEKSDLYVL